MPAFWREVGCATIIHMHALRMLLSEGVCLHHRLPSLCWGLGGSARILALRAVVVGCARFLAGFAALGKKSDKKKWRCVALRAGSLASRRCARVAARGLQSSPLKS